uniref:Uncharacterized protein n=1 Tax=Glossina pallidipes TaxID=7398 RepID=A0A1B0A2A1_GLOPL
MPVALSKTILHDNGEVCWLKEPECYYNQQQPQHQLNRLSGVDDADDDLLFGVLAVLAAAAAAVAAVVHRPHENLLPSVMAAGCGGGGGISKGCKSRISSSVRDSMQSR